MTVTGRTSKPTRVYTPQSRAGGEEFVIGSAASPDDELEFEELPPSVSSEEAIESEPEMEIESLAVASQFDEPLGLEEPTIDSSLTSLEEEALSSEDGEEAVASDYLEEEEANPSEYREEAIPSDEAEELAMASDEEAIESAYEEELAMASVLSEESAESPSGSLPSRGHSNAGEDGDLEEYTAKALDEEFSDWESTATSSEISTERLDESEAAMSLPSAPAADIEEDSVPSSPSSISATHESMPQESMPSQTEEAGLEALECTGAPEMPPKDKEDPSILIWTTSAPPSSSEDEDGDLAEEEETSMALPSSAEGWDKVAAPPSSPSVETKSVTVMVSDVAEGIGHIEDPLPAAAIVTASPETEDDPPALPLDMEGYGTLDTEACIQRPQGPSDNVPCRTKQTETPKKLSTETEPCDKSEEGDSDTEKKGGSTLLSPPIAEGETQQDPTQEPAVASEPAPTVPLFCHRAYRPQTSKAKKLPKLVKPFIEHEAQKGAARSKTTRRPRFPRSSPSATAAEADRKRSTGPAVTYPTHKSPVYQPRRRSGQQHRRSSDAGTDVPSSSMSHLDQAWARKDTSKSVETETGHILFDRDDRIRYGRWKPAETQFTTHQPDHFRAEAPSAKKCIVYRRIPCGKSHTLSHSFLNRRYRQTKHRSKRMSCSWLLLVRDFEALLETWLFSTELLNSARCPLRPLNPLLFSHIRHPVMTSLLFLAKFNREHRRPDSASVQAVGIRMGLVLTIDL